MPKQNQSIGAGISLILIIICIAFMVPAIILSLSGTQTIHETQLTNEEMVLTGSVTSTVTNFSQTEMNVTILNKETTNKTEITNLVLGETANIPAENGYINVTYENYVNSNAVLVTYDYPTYINWPEGSKFIVENIVLYLLSLVTIMFTALSYFIATKGGSQ